MYTGSLQNKTAKIYSETCLNRKLHTEICLSRKTFNVMEIQSSSSLMNRNFHAKQGKKKGRLWFRCTEDSLHSIQPNFTPVSNHVNYKGVSTLTSVQSSVSPHNFCIISYGFCSTYGKYHQNYYTLPCELTLIKKRMLLFNA